MIAARRNVIMSKIAILFLTIFVFGSFCAVQALSQTADPLEEANRLYREGKFTQAATAYQTLLDKFSDAPTRAKIIFNLGKTYQQLKQYDKAIETFKSIFETKADDYESAEKLITANRDYRSHIPWEIGSSLFGKGDYSGALNAFRMTHEKYPFPCFCGTCLLNREYEYALYEAISLEYLNRYDEAVNLYWKIYEPRLAELYYAAGQLDDLKAIVAKKDEAYFAYTREKYGLTREKAVNNSPMKNLKDAIAVYDMEKAGDWNGLTKLAIRFASARGNGRRNTAVEALARYPKEIFPFIKQKLDKLNAPVRITKLEQLKELDEREYIGIYYEILAALKTDESIAFLKETALKERNYDGFAIVRALDSAGEKGATALRELEPLAKENLKTAIGLQKTGGLETEKDIVVFPTIVRLTSKLPIDL